MTNWMRNYSNKITDFCNAKQPAGSESRQSVEIPCEDFKVKG